MSEYRINQITNQVGTAGPQVAGITTFSSSSGLVMPSGVTEYRGGRGRGVWGGGYTPTQVNTMDFVTISTQSNAIDFGDLSQIRVNLSASSSSTRGLFGGGVTPSSPNVTNIIDYITISSTGNAFDFGDLFTGRYALSSTSSTVRSLFAGGHSPASTSIIDYVTISTLGNASVFGNLSVVKVYTSSCSSNTRGIFAGGGDPGFPGGAILYNAIDYVTIATTGNAQDFGDLTLTRRGSAGCSSNVRGLFGGGVTPTTTNVIDYITIASLGDAIDFGDLTSAKVFYGTSACSSQTRGLWAGGPSPYTTAIDFVTIATTGNASSFGNLTQARQALAACSDAHGGLGD